MDWVDYQRSFNPRGDSYQDLETFLGTKRIDLDIESEWASAALPPSDIPLENYLATVRTLN